MGECEKLQIWEVVWRSGCVLIGLGECEKDCKFGFLAVREEEESDGRRSSSKAG